MQVHTSLSINDVILIRMDDIGIPSERRNAIGIIRYIGSIYGYAMTEFVGIELLDAMKGAHDGTINDYQYFQTKPQHGWHVRLTSIVKKLHASDVVKKMRQVIDLFTKKLEEYVSALHHRDVYISKLKKEKNQLQDRVKNLKKSSHTYMRIAQKYISDSRTGSTVKKYGNDNLMLTPTPSFHRQRSIASSNPITPLSSSTPNVDHEDCFLPFYSKIEDTIVFENDLILVQSPPLLPLKRISKHSSSSSKKNKRMPVIRLSSSDSLVEQQLIINRSRKCSKIHNQFKKSIKNRSKKIRRISFEHDLRNRMHGKTPSDMNMDMIFENYVPLLTASKLNLHKFIDDDEDEDEDDVKTVSVNVSAFVNNVRPELIPEQSGTSIFVSCTDTLRSGITEEYTDDDEFLTVTTTTIDQAVPLPSVGDGDVQSFSLMSYDENYTSDMYTDDSEKDTTQNWESSTTSMLSSTAPLNDICTNYGSKKHERVSAHTRGRCFDAYRTRKKDGKIEKLSRRVVGKKFRKLTKQQKIVIQNIKNTIVGSETEIDIYADHKKHERGSSVSMIANAYATPKLDIEDDDPFAMIPFNQTYPVMKKVKSATMEKKKYAMHNMHHPTVSCDIPMLHNSAMQYAVRQRSHPPQSQVQVPTPVQVQPAQSTFYPYHRQCVSAATVPNSLQNTPIDYIPSSYAMPQSDTLLYMNSSHNNHNNNSHRSHHHRRLPRTHQRSSIAALANRAATSPKSGTKREATPRCAVGDPCNSYINQYSYLELLRIQHQQHQQQHMHRQQSYSVQSQQQTGGHTQHMYQQQQQQQQQQQIFHAMDAHSRQMASLKRNKN